MITNKDIRVENGSLILNGDPYPLDGQSPETIMEIVEDNSDTTPTENSSAPITSGGIYNTIGDLTQTAVSGASVAAQLGSINTVVQTLVTVDSATVTTLSEIAAGANVSFTADATKAGYTPVGVVGIYGSGIRDLTITQFYTASTNAFVWLTNNTAAAVTPSSITMQVLYVKSFT